jgi:hypothetical protein
VNRLSAALLTVGLAFLSLAGPAFADGGNGSGGENITVRVLGPATVGCTDDHGKHLGNNPHLHRKQQCHLHLTGFAPRQRVRITLHSAPRDLGEVTATSNGTLDYTFTVPADLSSGPHTVMFVAQDPAVAVAFPFVVDVPPGQTGNGPTGSPHSPESGSHGANGGGGGGQSGNGGGGGLAQTGESIVQLLELAMVLVGAGVVTLVAGRRRSPQTLRQVPL